MGARHQMTGPEDVNQLQILMKQMMILRNVALGEV